MSIIGTIGVVIAVIVVGALLLAAVGAVVAIICSAWSH